MRPRYIDTVFKCLKCGQPAIHPLHDRCLLGMHKITPKRERLQQIVAKAIETVAKGTRP